MPLQYRTFEVPECQTICPACPVGEVQAEEFSASSGVTAIALTKLDGTSRGGALLGVQERLQIPIKLIGLGEKAGDLKDFDPKSFAEGMFD